MTPEDQAQLTDARPFDEFLRELRRGAALHDAGLALQDVVRAVEATGKAGTLTIKLTISPDEKYGTAVEVADDITTKLPKPKTDSSLFYMDGSHSLVRTDPNQMTFTDR
jgi:hypothetical protein